MQNRTIENPIIGDRVTFVRTSAETGGKVSEIVVELSPGGGNEPHYHTLFTESFTPIRGDLGVLVGEEKRTLHTGETTTVPPGVVHCFFNPTDRMVRFRGEAGPGLVGLERFAQIAYGLARDGEVNKKGVSQQVVPYRSPDGDGGREDSGTRLQTPGSHPPVGSDARQEEGSRAAADRSLLHVGFSFPMPMISLRLKCTVHEESV